MSELTKIQTSRLKTEEITNDVFNDKITNCITEIPQDIKLELVVVAKEIIDPAYDSLGFVKSANPQVGDGVYWSLSDTTPYTTITSVEDNWGVWTAAGSWGELRNDITGVTLKAGSKVYVPNGSDTFDIVNITTDISTSGVSYNGNAVFIFYINGGLAVKDSIQIASGPTAPAALPQDWWYDTTNNIIKQTTDFSTWIPVGNCSLPLALITLQNSTPYIKSLNQVFNGFGYIGKTMYVLPGVSGLAPYGRDANGKIQNLPINITSVKTQNITTTSQVYSDIRLSNNGIGAGLLNYVFMDNINYTNTHEPFFGINLGRLYFDGTRIIQFSVKNIFRALDYNNTSEISGWSSPGNRKIDLTFGASGATYTAPANGWFCVYGIASVGNGYVDVAGKLIAGGQNSSATGSIWVTSQVKRGDVITIRYANYTNQNFYFRYAEGEI